MTYAEDLPARPSAIECPCRRCRFDAAYDQHLNALQAQPRDPAVVESTHAELLKVARAIDRELER